jgi:hypothetical protein
MGLADDLIRVSEAINQDRTNKVKVKVPIKKHVELLITGDPEQIEDALTYLSMFASDKGYDKYQEISKDPVKLKLKWDLTAVAHAIVDIKKQFSGVNIQEVI